MPAAAGVFAVNLVVGVIHEDAQDGTGDPYRTFFRARTWLHEDMLGEEQVPLAPGAPPLGDTLLLPAPLRTMTVGGGNLTVERIRC